jgi:putative drug exporter of the RND superfamily
VARQIPPPSSSSGAGVRGPLASWAALVTRRPWRVLLSSLVLVIVFGAFAATRAGEFSDSFTLPGAESQAAYTLLEERFPQQAGSSATLVFKTDNPGGIADPGVSAEINGVLDEIAGLPHVVGILSPFDAPQQISEDGAIAYATVAYDKQAGEIPLSDLEELTALVDRSSSASLQVEAGGEIVAQTEFEIGNTAELIGLAAATVILLVSFGSVVAMGLPILTALLGLGIGFLGIGVATNYYDIATFAPAFATMIGIGVGIDYALFIVTRFREGLSAGLTPKEAVVRAVDTAGRAVIFAGSVVVISMLGLSAIGVPFVTAIGIAAAIVVGAAVIVALIFLPAFLALVGLRIDKWSVRRNRNATETGSEAFGRRLARRIQQTPVRFMAASTGILLLLAVPLLDLQLGFPDAGANPTSYHTRRAYDLLTEGFGPGFNNPLIVVVENGGGLDPAMLDTIAAAASDLPDVVFAAEPMLNEAGDTAVMTIIPTTGANDSETKDLVKELRQTILPSAVAGTSATAYVGGPTGSFLDFSDRLVERTPLVFVVIIGLSFLLLTVVFRSPVIALKAAIMNMLSIAAAFGVIIAVFQWGWGSSLIGLEETQPIAVFMPMFLFAILFGLSMDYEVFLLSRIREFWVRGRSTSDAVAEGLAVTARVITAAAAIMISVFFSFVFTGDPITKQFGLGLAVAILIDATLVRLVLVPSTMEVLGKWNWWIPSWLERLMPHVNIEGTHENPPLAPEPLPAPLAAD